MRAVEEAGSNTGCRKLQLYNFASDLPKQQDAPDRNAGCKRNVKPA